MGVALPFPGNHPPRYRQRDEAAERRSAGDDEIADPHDATLQFHIAVAEKASTTPAASAMIPVMRNT